MIPAPEGDLYRVFLPRMQVTLRNYSPPDFETLYAIDQACFPRRIAYSRRTLRWFLQLEGAECVLAQIQDEPTALTAGFAVAEWERSEGHIVTLDVLAEYRRSGVGSELLAEIERRLAGKGVRRVSLETAVSNDAAVAFWLRHGYEGDGVIRGYYPGRIDAHHMVKRLADTME